MNLKKLNKGFTLIEILVVIAIIAILAAIVLVSLNPAKRFQDARNTQRQANVESILGAIQQNMVDHKGITTCTIPTGDTAGIIKSSATAPDTDLTTCLAPYLAVLPFDPSNTSAKWTSPTDYDTEYTVTQNATTKQVTVSAPEATKDGSAAISLTR